MLSISSPPPPTKKKKGESPLQMILKCKTKTASACAPEWLIPLPRFVRVHVWVTFIAICFTCSQILVPLTVLSHLAFLLGLHLGNKDTSCCVCKELCHSGIFFLLLEPSIFYYQPSWGNARIMSPEKSEKDKNYLTTLRPSHSNWEYNQSSGLLWKHTAFSWHFNSWPITGKEGGPWTEPFPALSRAFSSHCHKHLRVQNTARVCTHLLCK